MQLANPSRPAPLLGRLDPAPVEVVRGASGWVLSVEHGGTAVPRTLGDLGLPPGEIERHIGWDPGAADLARALRERIDATLVLQPYSRLVIDCNRPWGAPDLAAEVSDWTEIPANRGMEEAGLRARWEAIHAPFHAALGAACEAPGVRGLVAVHTYAPQRRLDPAIRPWPVGLLWRRDNPLARMLAERLSREAEAQPLGLNRPYGIDDASDYTLPVQAEPRGLPHVLLEVRHDLLTTPEAVARMAGLLARALTGDAA